MLRELRALYDELDAEVATRGWTCRACGNCCRFADSGQVLFCTPVEAQYLAEDAQLPDSISEEHCVFLVEGRCSRRDRRTLCCRTYFCQQAGTGKMESLTERYLARLKTLHDENGIPWEYTRFTEHLNRRKAKACKG